MQLKTALRKMHKSGFVHSDIKPDNILWSPSKRTYVLCDFGISRPLIEFPGQHTLTFPNGTPKYMAPALVHLMTESIQGEVDLYECDLYSLNKTLTDFKREKVRVNKL